MEERARDMTFEQAWEWIKEHSDEVVDLIVADDIPAVMLLKLLIGNAESPERQKPIFEAGITRAVKILIERHPELEEPTNELS